MRIKILSRRGLHQKAVAGNGPWCRINFHIRRDLAFRTIAGQLRPHRDKMKEMKRERIKVKETFLFLPFKFDTAPAHCKKPAKSSIISFEPVNKGLRW